MDLYCIDYISVYGGSWLHRAPVGIKMVVLLTLIAALLWLRYVVIVGGLLAAVLIVAVSARLPLRLFLPLMLYPVIFLVIIFVSTAGLNIYSVLLLVLRVLAITGSVVAFLLTTSYPKIFGALRWVLPGVLVAALFFTYRSIFVISDSVNNMRIALHLRGGIDWRKPRSSLSNFGTALGHLLLHIIESSERNADSLRVRGFTNRLYYLDEAR